MVDAIQCLHPSYLLMKSQVKSKLQEETNLFHPLAHSNISQVVKQPLLNACLRTMLSHLLIPKGREGETVSDLNILFTLDMSCNMNIVFVFYSGEFSIGNTLNII